MKKTSKIFVLLMCLALLASVIGCTAQGPAATSTPKPATKLDAIKAKGYIVWGTNAAFPPFELKDSAGKVIGVDKDIAQAVADALNVTLRVEDMEFDSLPAALKSGKIDFIGAGFSKTEERAKSMDFSVDYYTAVQVVIVKDGSKIATEADLKNKKIGVQTGTTGSFIAEEISGVKMSNYNSLTLACQDLKNGRIDAVIGDNLPITMIQGQISGLTIVSAIKYDEEKYALAVDKGNAELLTEINKVLNTLITKGTIAEKIKLYSTTE